MKAYGLLLTVMLSICVVGCDNSTDGVGGGTLDGTKWTLTGWTLSSQSPVGYSITANFDGGQISGHGGVNSYGGPYFAGLGDTFSAGPLVSTMMAGSVAAMSAESTYFMLLGQVRTYKLAGGKLTLYDGDGNESLVFEAAP